MVTNHEYHSSIVAFASAEEECQLLSVALEVAWIFTLNSEITDATRRVGRFSYRKTRCVGRFSKMALISHKVDLARAR